MTDPRIHERRVRVARETGRHRRRSVIIGLLVVLLGAGGFALVHSSVFGARHIEVSGATHVSDATIVRTAGLEGAPPLVDLSAPAIAQRIEALAWVRTATVALSWPETVSIHLTERVPVAVMASPAGGFDLLDPTGRVLEQVTLRPAGFPLVTSAATPPAAGRRVARATATLAQVAAAMPESMVPETESVGWSGHEIVVRLTSKVVAMFGDAKSLRDKFVALATLLHHGGLTGIGTIDLRVPSAPVLIKDAASPIVARNVGG